MKPFINNLLIISFYCLFACTSTHQLKVEKSNNDNIKSSKKNIAINKKQKEIPSTKQKLIVYLKKFVKMEI